ncbi:DUF1015 domain-containing protein [Nocardioidaceae bacterium SCSIO 66511]|nr:DUF1015 domain-containing protein [Nocardioidaceae bacterium SCSIO 66511]
MTSWQDRAARTVMRVRPFRGVTFTEHAGDPADLTFTPPTSWSTLPADLLERIDAHHILHLLAPAFGGHPASGAERARALLRSWLDDEVLRHDAEPAMYVYAQPAGDSEVVGVIATVDLVADGGGPFLDHEEVIAPLVDVQETLEQTTNAQIEPILALCHEAAALGDVLREIVGRPADLAVAQPDVGTHRLWRIDDSAVQLRIAQAVPDAPALIADGHHRHSAWSRVAARDGTGPATRALALLVHAPQPGIRLGAIHRVLADVDLATAIGSESIDAAALPNRSAAADYLASGPTAGCVLHSGGAYYAVVPRVPNAECAAPELAVCHLHAGWLKQWAVADADVGYVHGLDEAIAQTTESGVAVLLPAPRLEDVMAAARDGRPLPRKATSFGPKPLVGAVFRSWLGS